MAASRASQPLAAGPRAGRARLSVLLLRRQFLAAASQGRKAASAGMVVQARQHGDDLQPSPTPIRVGLTASKKVGNAVARNRARRRLRALAVELLPDHAAPGHDYVLIARAATVTRPFADLRSDLVSALKRLKLWRDGETAPPAETAS